MSKMNELTQEQSKLAEWEQHVGKLQFIPSTRSNGELIKLQVNLLEKIDLHPISKEVEGFFSSGKESQYGKLHNKIARLSKNILCTTSDVKDYIKEQLEQNPYYRHLTNKKDGYTPDKYYLWLRLLSDTTGPLIIIEAVQCTDICTSVGKTCLRSLILGNKSVDIPENELYAKSDMEVLLDEVHTHVEDIFCKYPNELESFDRYIIQVREIRDNNLVEESQVMLTEKDCKTLDEVKERLEEICGRQPAVAIITDTTKLVTERWSSLAYQENEKNKY
ncbi:hypothetical protein CN918_31235 [Priestia megaterium]|nr:hypothetical protein CN918_31235 [Priestia megaterium]